MISTTSKDLENEIQDLIPKLLEIARESTWNKISDNCRFILSEIKNSELNFFERCKLRKKENDRKTPCTLSEIISVLKTIYDNLYDVNLEIYRSTSQLTIIDVRYYPKSSLNETFRQEVITSPPMLHCKVSLPPGLSVKNEKFDINWEHKILFYRWKMFWLRLKFRNK